jgi:cytochrome oxidase assembly protein ShyY1
VSQVAPDIQSGRARQATWRGRIILTLFALGAFGILIALGLWQLQRRDWKKGSE